MNDTFGYKKVKARKVRRCFWCGENIENGETYSRWCYSDGGKARTVRVHEECGAAWIDMYDVDWPTQYGQSRGCRCEKGRCECGKESVKCR